MPNNVPQLSQINTVGPNGQIKTNQYVRSEITNQAKIILNSFALNTIKPLLFTISNQEKLQVENEAKQQGLNNKHLSLFGLPVFDPLVFAQKQYETLDKELITVDQLELGLVLIEVSKTKYIIKTPIQGRNTTIKEYISDGDYNIMIRGVLSSGAVDVFPEDQFRMLNAFADVPESIEVASPVLNRFGITDIVIEEFNVFQDEAYRNLCRFEIRAVSDVPFEIKTTKL